MHVALRKNVLRDHADAFGRGKQRAHLRLHVGRKTGIRLGRELEWLGQAPFGETVMEFFAGFDLIAGRR